MTSDEAPAPDGGTSSAGAPEFDTSVAHQARMYDYLLGGKDNYAADRAATEAALEVYPDWAFTARANRAFLGRAVRYLTADAGMRQFLDIGTGIPTAGNIHQVAQKIAPETRVVYVDYDPVVLAHARALLTGSRAGATEYIDCDLRKVGAILKQASRLLDFTSPVAVTLVAILHAIPDADDPHAIVAQLVDAVPSGSYLALSHLGREFLPPETLRQMEDLSRGNIQQQFAYRSRDQVEGFFTGLDLVEPGLVPVEEWRPDTGTTDTGKSALWCAVGRKR
jgi:SAM-dependent methyltransferase